MTETSKIISSLLIEDMAKKDFYSEHEFCKKRKLSMNSDASDGSTGERNLLAEKFNDLNLNHTPTVSTSVSVTQSTDNTTPFIYIPKPIKNGKLFDENDKLFRVNSKLNEAGYFPEPSPKMNFSEAFSNKNAKEFGENLLKMMLHQELELELKRILYQDLTKVLLSGQSELDSAMRMNDSNSVLSTNAFLTNTTTSKLTEDTKQSKQEKISTQESQVHAKMKEKMIGSLTVSQRRAKIAKYLEKKQRRNWRNIRYDVRKDLATKRERVQGRFVKKGQTPSQPQEFDKENFNILNSIQESNDQTLGKRKDKTDLITNC